MHATSVTFVSPGGAKQGMLMEDQPVTAVHRQADAFPKSWVVCVVQRAVRTERTRKPSVSSLGARHGSNVATIVVGAVVDVVVDVDDAGGRVVDGEVGATVVDGSVGAPVVAVR